MDDPAPLWRSWAQAAARSDIDAALGSLYAELDAAVAARGPTCWASGKCCRFDDYGHRLYVTGLEIAWFLRQVRRAEPPADSANTSAEPVQPGATGGGMKGGESAGGGVRLPQLAEHPGACPYQVGGLCSTHLIRPLGCRVFFCQAGTEEWQQDLYETFLRRLTRLHEQHDVPYRYMDWIAGLEEGTALATQHADPS